jgi:hypothetical protein
LHQRRGINTRTGLTPFCTDRPSLPQALLDRGVTDIVRVGGRSKSERMKQLQLKEIASAPASAGAGGKASNLGQAERRRLWQVQTELDGLQEEVKALTERLAALEDAPRPPAPGSGPLPQGGSGRGAGGRSGRQAAPAPPPTAAEQWRRRAELDVRGGRGRGGRDGGRDGGRQGRGRGRPEEPLEQQQQPPPPPEAWTSGVSDYLKTELPDVHSQLQVPPGCDKQAGYLWRRWTSGAIDKGQVAVWQRWRERARAGGFAGAGGGWQVAGAEKAAATAHFRERLAALKAAEARWAHVADPAAGPVEMLEDIWALPPRLRAPLAAAWRRGARGEAAEELAGVLERVGRLQQERTELYDGSLEAVLRKVGAR